MSVAGLLHERFVGVRPVIALPAEHRQRAADIPLRRGQGRARARAQTSNDGEPARRLEQPAPAQRLASPRRDGAAAERCVRARWDSLFILRLLMPCPHRDRLDSSTSDCVCPRRRAVDSIGPIRHHRDQLDGRGGELARGAWTRLLALIAPSVPGASRRATSNGARVEPSVPPRRQRLRSRPEARGIKRGQLGRLGVQPPHA